MVRYVLFDFDGTVYDTVEGITKSVRYAINKIGLDASLEELRCFAGPPLVDKFMEVFGLSQEAAEQAVADFRERYLPIGLYESHVFPGISELLHEIRARGIVTAIATSKPQPLAEELLKKQGIDKLFDLICGSGEQGNNDSKSDVIRRAMESLGASADDTVLVGDTKYDVYGAHECGLKCIGVRYGYAAPGELESEGADFIADDLDGVKKLLLNC